MRVTYLDLFMAMISRGPQARRYQWALDVPHERIDEFFNGLKYKVGKEV
jgi:hypothetical protein